MRRCALLGLTVLVLAACGGGGLAGGIFSRRILFLATFETWTWVIGQAGEHGALPNKGFAAPTAESLNRPGAPVAAGGRFYVPDAFNHRVLGFTAVPNTSNASAAFVIGQPSLATATAGTSASALDTPYALWATPDRLFVSDTGNNRVLVYLGLPVSFSTAATTVLGQGTFATSATGTTAASMDSPVGVCAHDAKLLVADRDNHRVLIWTTLPTTSGAPADLVLGQADFTSGLANRGGAAAANALNWPWGVWTDGTRVVVADAANHRVLVWNSFPTTNGQAADLVLGQPDFTTTAPGLSATAMNTPTDVTSNEIQLFVADCENNRVLLWDVFPTVSGQTPNKVLGQGDFVHGRSNDDNQDGLDDGQPSQRTLRSGGGFLFVRLDQRNLFVGDHRNNRVVIWRGN